MTTLGRYSWQDRGALLADCLLENMLYPPRQIATHHQVVPSAEGATLSMQIRDAMTSLDEDPTDFVRIATVAYMVAAVGPPKLH
jgi:hypothetical protein